MRTRFLSALATVFIAATMAATQDNSSSKKPARFIVNLRDGSRLFVSASRGDLVINTKYGKLTVPIEEIYRIDFGIHYPNGLKEKIANSINSLGSQVYKEREEACKYLQNEDIERFVYPLLKKAVKKKEDAERTQRVMAILKNIEKRAPPEVLATKEEDVVQTAEFTVSGHLDVKNPTIEVHSPALGNPILKFCDIRAMYGNTEQQKDFQVDAIKDDWFNTNVFVRQNMKLAITAEGQVDLWPMTLGQYVATPKGCTTTGKGGMFTAGALVGRIGDQGKAFLIGEHYDSTILEEGKLFLQIIPSPWNNASSGWYRVHIATRHR